jgi:hypothetical protein
MRLFAIDPEKGCAALRRLIGRQQLLLWEWLPAFVACTSAE